MKLLSVRAENIMRCKLAEVSFENDVVVIGGNNGQGKSSFAKAIWMAFGGKDAIPEEPVTEGASFGAVHIELDGDFILSRVISQNRETVLELRNKEGGKYPSPQRLLDSFNLQFGFWPQQFIMMAPKEQAETLKKVVGLDFTKQEMKARSLRDERTITGRELQRAKGALEARSIHKDVPEEEISIPEVFQALKEGTAHNDERERLSASAKTLELQAASIDEEILLLQQKIETMRASRDAKLEAAVQHLNKVADMPIIDISELEKRIKDSHEVNKKIAENRETYGLSLVAEGIKKKYEGLTAEIDTLEEEKQAALREAKFPVQGLGFDERGVTYQGKPFSQASTGLQWETAVSIGFALNPDLKLIYVEYGSLLDQATMERIEQMTREHGGQLLVEVVGDDDDVTVLFENGVGKTKSGESNEKDTQSDAVQG